MKRHLFLAALCVCDVGAFAQPLQGAGGADSVVAHQQRKAALRDALQTGWRAESRTEEYWDLFGAISKQESYCKG